MNCVGNSHTWHCSILSGLALLFAFATSAISTHAVAQKSINDFYDAYPFVTEDNKLEGSYFQPLNANDIRRALEHPTISLFVQLDAIGIHCILHKELVGDVSAQLSTVRWQLFFYAPISEPERKLTNDIYQGNVESLISRMPNPATTSVLTEKFDIYFLFF
jgi:hypothetical protein